ncbi:hypothetical protein KC726_04890 [Candidatus Woesebacteria bacterium]|nr:hypothetical protein [Candidatus Woesebacteria bacterium]
MKKHIIRIAVIVGIILIFARHLSPFSQEMFVGHDETQAARIVEFSYDLQHGMIPPRIALHMSYGLGYPLFNYYAPFAYWVTSGLHMVGFDVVSALQLSFGLALLTGGLAMYLFLRHNLRSLASLVGSIAYVSSPFVAVDIFVRANLAELWFFALLPLAFFMLERNDKKRALMTAIVLSCLFTVHNVFSLVSVGIIAVYIFLIKKSRVNVLAFFGGLLLSSYFLIPAVVELPLVHAAAIATKTHYQDHFLCFAQLWSSPWGFAGSAPGCTADGMSFMLGKVQILFGVGGVLLALMSIVFKKTKKWFSFIRFETKNNHEKTLILFMAVITIVSLFLTLPVSQIVWQMFEPVLALFQFPWRFLLISVFGLSFFVAYGIDKLRWENLHIVVGLCALLGMLLLNGKFFQGQTRSKETFHNTYVSQEYIVQKAAYKVQEYLPTTADYDAWKTIEQTEDVTKPKGIGNFNALIDVKGGTDWVAPIHYAPYWHITVNNKEIVPKKFDTLGRPLLRFEHGTTVTITYRQTTVEILSNILTLMSFIALAVMSEKEQYCSLFY